MGDLKDWKHGCLLSLNGKCLTRYRVLFGYDLGFQNIC